MQHQQQRNVIAVLVRHVVRSLAGAFAGGMVGTALGVLVMIGLFLVFGLAAEAANNRPFAEWWSVQLLAMAILGTIFGGGGGLCGGTAGALSRAWLSRSVAVALGASISVLVVMVILRVNFGVSSALSSEIIVSFVLLSLATAVGGGVGSFAARP